MRRSDTATDSRSQFGRKSKIFKKIKMEKYIEGNKAAWEPMLKYVDHISPEEYMGLRKKVGWLV